jgi:hypothetical protein
MIFRSSIRKFPWLKFLIKEQFNYSLGWNSVIQLIIVFLYFIITIKCFYSVNLIIWPNVNYL